MRSMIARVASLATVFALVPSAVIAQEAESKPSLLALQSGLMFWTLVVFLVLLFILSKFAFGPITAAVRSREQALEDAIAAAKKDRDDAAKLLEEHRRAIEAARGEGQRFIAEGRAAAEAMRGEMLEQTRQQQQDLLDRARKDIDAEKVKAIAELRREAVDLAIAGASRVIEKNLDDAGNRALVESYLATLSVKR
ncbi:MAG: F0F1 ATP synthase subunit B [Gemmatimonadales bacterium]